MLDKVAHMSSSFTVFFPVTLYQSAQQMLLCSAVNLHFNYYYYVNFRLKRNKVINL